MLIGIQFPSKVSNISEVQSCKLWEMKLNYAYSCSDTIIQHYPMYRLIEKKIIIWQNSSFAGLQCLVKNSLPMKLITAEKSTYALINHHIAPRSHSQHILSECVRFHRNTWMRGWMKWVCWNGTQTQANSLYGLLVTFHGFVWLTNHHIVPRSLSLSHIHTHIHDAF